MGKYRDQTRSEQFDNAARETARRKLCVLMRDADQLVQSVEHYLSTPQVVLDRIQQVVIDIREAVDQEQRQSYITEIKDRGA